MLGQIVEDEDVHGIEAFNSVDNVYKSILKDQAVVELYLYGDIRTMALGFIA